MKFTLNWLKEFVPVKLSPKELGERLTHVGLEVESVQKVGEIPAGVIVAQIEKMEKHPQADRLTVCRVNVGGEYRTIVCGAKNMKETDKVALASPGTLLPDGKKIEKTKLRGVDSEGMLCSEKELGLLENSAGLMILPTEAKLGSELSEALSVSDTLFEVNVTPNRADCLSILGIAREVAAFTGEALKEIVSVLPPRTFSLKDRLTLELPESEKSFCPRYTARLMQGIKVAPSPWWVALRLAWLGVRSINNVVDATNYVMLELGHPLHAFDYQMISGKKIIVKRPAKKIRIKTLDDQEREVGTEDLLIQDTEKPLAIAGVMGLSNSGVEDSTNTLVLEAAAFQPTSIRKTSRHLGLSSESSYRFERGVDPNGLMRASDRLAQYIHQWAGGEISEEVLDSAPEGFASKKINLRKSRIQKILGKNFEGEKITQTLDRLSLKPHSLNSDSWNCSVPTWRFDLDREIDLIEEVARSLGYQEIPASLPAGAFKPAKDHSGAGDEVRLRNVLKGLSFVEAIHYSFCAPELFQKIGLSTERSLTLANPLSEDLSMMRSSLIPNILSCLQKNLSYQNKNLRVYELRTVFQQDALELQENQNLALGLMGMREQRHWAFSQEPLDFYDLKAVLEKIWQEFKFFEFELRPSKQAYLHPGVSAEIWVEGIKVGDFGLIHPLIAEKFDLPPSVLLAEIVWSVLKQKNKNLKRYSSLPRFPGIERDLTLLAPEVLVADELKRAFEKIEAQHLKSVHLVDVYQGEPIPVGKKAFTYSLFYQDLEGTLTDEEVNVIHEEVVKKIQNLLPVEWR